MTNSYTLSFLDAIQKCLLGQGFIRGENFADGIYVDCKDGILVLVDGKDYSVLENLYITGGVIKQKYKIFTVANKEELNLKN